MITVPFFDLKRLHEEIRDSLDDGFRRVADTGFFILGPEVEVFEVDFARYCGVEHCVGVGNGLDALRLILHAMGLGPRDEVIVPAQTFIATWLAVTCTGATPVPVDVEEGTANIDPERIEGAVTSRTRAIVAVHLFGQPADMDRINAVATKYGLPVVEDAAQAHGAYYRGKRAGNLAEAAAFSFYPSKNLGALADAGAVVTNNAKLAHQIHLLRNYGSAKKYVHEVVGFNSRLDEVQAAFLSAKLPHLDRWNRARDKVARRYTELIGALNSDIVVPPWRVEGTEPVWHLYVVRTKRRDEFRRYLASRGIQTGVHYPNLPHWQEAYGNLGYAVDAFPTASRFARESVSLPMGPYLTEAEIDCVVDAVTSFVCSVSET